MTTKSKAKAKPASAKSNPFDMQAGSARAKTLDYLVERAGKAVPVASVNLTALGYLMRRAGQKKLPFKITRTGEGKQATVTLRKA